MKKKIYGIIIISGLLLLPFTVFSAMKIKPFLVNPGQKTVTVRWESKRLKKGVVVYWRDNAPEKHQAQSKVKAVMYVTRSGIAKRSYWHQVVLTGLDPGTVYCYQVKCGNTEIPVKRFRTFPEKVDDFTFIVYGDPHHRPMKHRQVVKNFKQYKPAFIICVGDYVHTGTRYHEWKEQCFTPLSDVIDEIAIIPIRGNHDLGNPFFEHFGVDPKKPWSSFNYGNAHFSLLDVRFSDRRMLKWFRKNIKNTKAEWKFVFCHYPIFDPAFRGNAYIMDNYVPIFEESGVDVYFSGHCHSYQRFWPLISGENKNRKPVTYVITGGGGAPLSNCLKKYCYHAAAARKHNFVVMRLKGKILSARVYDENNNLIDSFTFSQKGKFYNKEYMASTKLSDPIKDETVIRSRMNTRITNTELLHKGKPYKFHGELNFPNLKTKTLIKIQLSEKAGKSYKMVPKVWEGVIVPGKKPPVFDAVITPLVEPRRAKWAFSPHIMLEVRYYMPDSKIEGFSFFTPALKIKD